jgi:putative transposase
MGRLNENRNSGKVLDAIRIDEGQIRSHLDALVKSSVEKTLNGLLVAEADSLCGAGKNEKSPERVDTRSGNGLSQAKWTQV